jgi:hypothetical protein
MLTEVSKGGDDLLHQGLQDLASCLWRVGHNGLPHMNSCLAHSVPNISSGHEQQCQHLGIITIISARLALTCKQLKHKHACRKHTRYVRGLRPVSGHTRSPRPATKEDTGSHCGHMCNLSNDKTETQMVSPPLVVAACHVDSTCWE